MMNRFLSILIIFPLYLGLTSCGFHLRGSLDNLSTSSLRGQKVYVSVIKDQLGLETDIRRVLLLSNVDVVSNPEKSRFQIFILKSTLARYASGLDTNGRTNEYEFIMQLDFVMAESKDILKDIQKSNSQVNDSRRIQASDELVEKEKTLKVSRFYYFDTNDLVGKKTEEKILLNEMKYYLSIQLLQQFTAFNNQHHIQSDLRKL